MKQQFERIIRYIADPGKGAGSGLKINIREQFQPDEQDSHSVARNLNAAFLIALSGESHYLYDKALGYLNGHEGHTSWGRTAGFYKDGLRLVLSEISGRCSADEDLKKGLTDLYSWIRGQEAGHNPEKTVEMFHQVFFPEGVSLLDEQNRKEKINSLREQRKIRISKLNPSPINDPAKEVLFTSNILVTVPPASDDIQGLSVSGHLKQMLKDISREDQAFWYDHPIPIGVSPWHNEALYGLEGLDEAVSFEKQRGTLDSDSRLTCVLSASATHKGLQGIVKEYLEDEFKKEKNIRHLDVYVFTEADTLELVNEILIPAAETYLGAGEHGILYEIVGVDGEYGRHYSFLRAVSAFWQVLIAPEIKGTFKIDLDQVFPQKELREQTGMSAFGHFKTPLWGAEGIDIRDNKVELGMIAGALVNQEDIDKSLFYPDVRFPDRGINADEFVFFSTLPQALSTEAEMMTRYTDNMFDGKKQCIQRMHVTGGTSGILVDSLRKYHPFTPTFIGRAEDQAYIMSVLFTDPQKNLRYVHKDGLIMRHDKEAFAKEAIKMAAAGKLTGDYIRILIFSYYVNALPWPFEDIKKTIGPFTGCFVSKIPLTVVYLRFALKIASFFDNETQEHRSQGFELLKTGSKRLHETIKKLVEAPDLLNEQFHKEKKGWKLFYDILDTVEKKLGQNDKFALDLKKKAEALVRGCRINFEVK
ncbi:MAG TPA: hypothetical protein ENH31_05095 [Nitrospirae bacterium]|nr:hypothetical protein [Nitrospirota bacterium]HDK81931.1 hypothetical protein [Nitrospirota bacterium]